MSNDPAIAVSEVHKSFGMTQAVRGV